MERIGFGLIILIKEQDKGEALCLTFSFGSRNNYDISLLPFMISSFYFPNYSCLVIFFGWCL